MFTWICPQCGREVPPAYNECPDCTAKERDAAAQPAAPAQPGSPAMAAPPPRPAPPPPPPPSSGVQLPAWLMSIVFAVAFIAIGIAAYFGIQRFTGTASGKPANGGIRLENPTAAARPKTNSTLQKYVEIVGLRLTEEPKRQPEVRFVVVNHSGAEISDFAANVNLWARTAKSDEEAVGTFSFKVPSLGPYEAKDMAGVLNTKLRVYELPDWQNLTAEIQITSPQ
jgi:hypothetical protein